MKIAIVTDTHFGARNDNLIFGAYIARFFKEVFIPYLDKHDIKHVIHCGDIVDRRKFVNYLTAKTLHEVLVLPLAKRKIDVKWIIGNHDAFFKETLAVNSMQQLYGDDRIYGTQEIIDRPRTIHYPDQDVYIDCYPWITKDNEERSFQLMRDPGSNIALGHFEFQGFDMYKGQPMLSGMDYNIMSKYLLVGSGHLHERSRKGNIQYLGCPYQLTWSDYGCPRGFSVLDTDTLEFEFIENPIQMFERIEYDDSKAMTLNDVMKGIPSIKDKIVKLVVLSKTQPDLYDTFYGLLEQQNPFQLRSIEDMQRVELNEVDVSATEDTLNILLKYAKVAETSQRNRLATLLTKLHNRALEQQIAI